MQTEKIARYFDLADKLIVVTGGSRHICDPSAKFPTEAARLDTWGRLNKRTYGRDITSTR